MQPSFSLYSSPSYWLCVWNVSSRLESIVTPCQFVVCIVLLSALLFRTHINSCMYTFSIYFCYMQYNLLTWKNKVRNTRKKNSSTMKLKLVCNDFELHELKMWYSSSTSNGINIKIQYNRIKCIESNRMKKSDIYFALWYRYRWRPLADRNVETNPSIISIKRKTSREKSRDEKRMLRVFSGVVFCLFARSGACRFRQTITTRRRTFYFPCFPIYLCAIAIRKSWSPDRTMK